MMSEAPARSPGAAAVRLGLAYFAVVFAIGCVLGALRDLLLAPRLGAPPAELLELPVMVAASWVVARGLLRRSRPGAGVRLGAGVLALLCLLGLELTLVLALPGRSVEDWIAARRSAVGAVWVLAMIAFALLPLLAGAGERVRRPER